MKDSTNKLTELDRRNFLTIAIAQDVITFDMEHFSFVPTYIDFNFSRDFSKHLRFVQNV